MNIPIYTCININYYYKRHWKYFQNSGHQIVIFEKSTKFLLFWIIFRLSQFALCIVQNQHKTHFNHWAFLCTFSFLVFWKKLFSGLLILSIGLSRRNFEFSAIFCESPHPSSVMCKVKFQRFPPIIKSSYQCTPHEIK